MANLGYKSSENPLISPNQTHPFPFTSLKCRPPSSLSPEKPSLLPPPSSSSSPSESGDGNGEARRRRLSPFLTATPPPQSSGSLPSPSTSILPPPMSSLSLFSGKPRRPATPNGKFWHFFCSSSHFFYSFQVDSSLSLPPFPKRNPSLCSFKLRRLPPPVHRRRQVSLEPASWI